MFQAPTQKHFTFDGEKEVSTVFLHDRERFETMLFDADGPLWDSPKWSFSEEQAAEVHTESVKGELGDVIIQDFSGLFESLE